MVFIENTNKAIEHVLLYVKLEKNREDELGLSCEKWEILHRFKEEINILHTIKRRKAN